MRIAQQTLVLMLLFMTGCGPSVPRTLSSPAVEGRVLEYGTNRPIEGAIVALTWAADSIPTGFISFHSSSTPLCYHAESATSDSAGRYRTATWRKPQRYNVPNGEFFAMAYKRGYRWIDTQGSSIYMSRFAGGADERIEDLSRSVMWCLRAGESERNLYPLRASLYYEAKELASKPRHEQEVAFLKQHAAFAAVAIDGDES